MPRVNLSRFSLSNNMYAEKTSATGTTAGGEVHALILG